MHLLRRFARDNLDARGNLILGEDERRQMAVAIDHGLRALDQFWETAAGRKLTDQEKGLVP